jgi:tight adherence protein C
MTPAATTAIAIAVLFGLCFGVGVCCLVSLIPRWGAPSLTRRIAPYVRDIGDPRGVTPWSAIGHGWSGSVRDAWGLARHGWTSLLGASEPISRRLAQAAWSIGVSGFRARQLVCAVVGLGVGGVFAVILALTGRASPALVVLPPVLALVGVVLCDLHLARAARKRVQRIQEELPTVLEFLALCLTAGEGLLDSIRRVSAVGAGELTGELRAVVVAVDTATPLADALRALSTRVQLAALSRSIDHVVSALDRGAPLAQVLQAQAADSRDEAKRVLIEQAGRKEILMLVPLVFMILPLSVVFAVYPGVFMLRLGVG